MGWLGVVSWWLTIALRVGLLLSVLMLMLGAIVAWLRETGLLLVRVLQLWGLLWWFKLRPRLLPRLFQYL